MIYFQILFLQNWIKWLPGAQPAIFGLLYPGDKPVMVMHAVLLNPPTEVYLLRAKTSMRVPWIGLVLWTLFSLFCHCSWPYLDQASAMIWPFLTMAWMDS